MVFFGVAFMCSMGCYGIHGRTGHEEEILNRESGCVVYLFLGVRRGLIKMFGKKNIEP